MYLTVDSTKRRRVLQVGKECYKYTLLKPVACFSGIRTCLYLVGFGFKGWISLPLAKRKYNCLLFKKRKDIWVKKNITFKEVKLAQHPQVPCLAEHGQGKIEIIEGNLKYLVRLSHNRFISCSHTCYGWQHMWLCAMASSTWTKQHFKDTFTL